MQIEFYPAAHEIRSPTEDCLDLLRQRGFQPTPSLVEGSFLCPVRAQSFDAFVEAIQQWTAKRPGRHTKPGEWKLQDVQGKDPTVTITVHRAPKEKAAGATA